MQALSSLQGAVLSAWTHPEDGLHESSVHGFPSSQLVAAPPWHVPPAQTSFAVQAFPSLHGPLLFAWLHPVVALHESVVHSFESSQLGAGPPTQTPEVQVSPVVQAFPSLQGPVLIVWTHPVEGLQESSVHALPSSQLVGREPWQTPAAQTS